LAVSERVIERGKTKTGYSFCGCFEESGDKVGVALLVRRRIL